MPTARDTIAAYIDKKADDCELRSRNNKHATEFAGQVASFRALASDIRAKLDVE